MTKERRIVLKLAYDGSAFCGWQVQPHCRSVQSTMERALSKMCSRQVGLTCAGRTDSGVHATAQYAHFDYQDRMHPQQMVKALNRILPYEVRVLDAMDSSLDFHSRYKAYERSYRYLLAKSISPFTRLYRAYMVNQAPQVEKMQHLSQVLLGSWDFSSFAMSNPEIPNRICDIKEISILEHEDHFEFRITADRFLHNMVRRIVGTLVNMCTKNIESDVLQHILTQADPRQTLVIPAPASGLYLTGVKYPQEYNIF